MNHLLLESSFGINKRNIRGETPLLVCLKLKRSPAFIKHLLISGADVMAADHKGITPLSVALSYHTRITYRRLLLEYGNADLQFTREPYISTKICEAVRYQQCQFESFVINRGLTTEKILLCIKTRGLPPGENVVLKDLNIFLDMMKMHQFVEDYNRIVCHTLVDHSMGLSNASVFKAIWEREHSRIATFKQSLMVEFFRECKFNCSEYIQCLHLILTSEHALYFINSFHNNNFLCWLSWSLKSRNIYKCNRIPILLRCVKFVNVTINDIRDTCGYFKFNVDVVILLQCIKPEELGTEYSHEISEFILKLENDPKLNTENLDHLELIPKLSYRRLINSAPEELLDLNPVIKRKREILNQVPTLFVLSKYRFQKSLQTFYNVEYVSEFRQIVRKLNLPSSIKKILCQEPPIYYE
ncbi:hypothetical protein ILUMI_13414 [Ignelater luminosus]|uniref:SOCS box domain-containing protein n=1 Tax=Ignelater luminosus TaxID=2038154 RepID=A0A8K0GBG5_IGNLU|nr:hypothetical protein ILUMI_13414 [Ignelater luminosus]